MSGNPLDLLSMLSMMGSGGGNHFGGSLSIPGSAQSGKGPTSGSSGSPFTLPGGSSGGASSILGPLGGLFGGIF